MHILEKEEHIPDHVLSASRKHFSGNCPTHGHAFFEIEYVIDGHATYLIDGTEYTVGAGTLILLSPANVHAVRDSDMELFNVMFACDPVEAALPLPDGATVLCADGEENAFFVALLTELVRTGDRRYALSLLQCVLQKLTLSLPHAAAPLPPYTRRAMLFIVNHFRRGITLEETARHLGLSKAYFSDLFQKQTGKSFKAYLDEMRFSYAENLLMLTDLPVGRVFAEAGFADYANFARRFKARQGVSPTEYRAQKAEKKAKDIDIGAFL